MVARDGRLETGDVIFKTGNGGFERMATGVRRLSRCVDVACLPPAGMCPSNFALGYICVAACRRLPADLTPATEIVPWPSPP